MVIGKVEHLETADEQVVTGEPLLYFKGRYRTTDGEPASD